MILNKLIWVVMGGGFNDLFNFHTIIEQCGLLLNPHFA